jgi:hypothetical protein
MSSDVTTIAYIAIPIAWVSIAFIRNYYKLRIKIEDNKRVSEICKTQFKIAKLRSSEVEQLQEEHPPPEMRVES